MPRAKSIPCSPTISCSVCQDFDLLLDIQQNSFPHSPFSLTAGPPFLNPSMGLKSSQSSQIYSKESIQPRTGAKGIVSMVKALVGLYINFYNMYKMETRDSSRFPSEIASRFTAPLPKPYTPANHSNQSTSILPLPTSKCPQKRLLRSPKLRRAMKELLPKTYPSGKASISRQVALGVALLFVDAWSMRQNEYRMLTQLIGPQSPQKHSYETGQRRLTSKYTNSRQCDVSHDEKRHCLCELPSFTVRIALPQCVMALLYTTYSRPLRATEGHCANWHQLVEMTWRTGRAEKH